jgi:hypothetical protein
MTTTRRRVVGYALLVAGVLALVGILVALIPTGIQFTWAFEFSAFALAVSFGAIALGEVGLLRMAFAVAAVGWVLVALTSVVAGYPGIPGLVGEVIALIGGVGGGILAWRRKIFGGIADLLFLFAMGVTGLYLLFTVIGTVPFFVQVFVAVIWALDLITVALFVLRRR